MKKYEDGYIYIYIYIYYDGAGIAQLVQQEAAI
jgi:hypothetical protein